MCCRDMLQIQYARFSCRNTVRHQEDMNDRARAAREASSGLPVEARAFICRFQSFLFPWYQDIPPRVFNDVGELVNGNLSRLAAKPSCSLEHGPVGLNGAGAVKLVIAIRIRR